MLVLLATLSSGLSISTKSIGYKGGTFSATVIPSTGNVALPPLVVLPPIGVGIDRTFNSRFVDEWAAAPVPKSALHAIDVIGMGDSQPKPRMKRPFGGWNEPPRTPTEWAEQTLTYIREEVREPCIVVGQSNLCTVALEAAGMDRAQSLVKGIILVGPPAIEALSIDKPSEDIAKVWRLVGSPLGAALFRFARRKAFLGSFSRKNLFADPSLVDDDYLNICAAGASDASTRHAVFSFVAGTWRKNYLPLLGDLAVPTLVVSGRDVGAGSGVGNAPPPPPPARAQDVDKTSYKGLLSWFTVWRKDGAGGRFDQVARDLGSDPAVKLRDFASAMTAAKKGGLVETQLLPGWNVLVYESPKELVATLGSFVERRFGVADGAQVWTEQAVELLEAAKAAKRERSGGQAAQEVKSWYDSGIRLKREKRE